MLTAQRTSCCSTCSEYLVKSLRPWSCNWLGPVNLSTRLHPIGRIASHCYGSAWPSDPLRCLTLPPVTSSFLPSSYCVSRQRCSRMHHDLDVTVTLSQLD